MSHTHGSDKKKVTVVVTGYGPFAHIKVNPSTTVAKIVAEGLYRRGDLAAVHVTELETSIAAAAEYFDKLEGTLDKALAADPAQKFLLFHVGVHGGEKDGVMRVETVGYNELHASVPDVRGVVFNHDTINAADGDTSATLTAFFADSEAARKKLLGIVEALNEKNKARAANLASHSASAPPMQSAQDASGSDAGGEGHVMQMPDFQTANWIISQDAGRYLCNYCLYRSLKLQQKYADKGPQSATSVVSTPPVVGVFIHVCDPQQGQATESGDAIARYNPPIQEQAQQTEMVAHELADWVMQA